MNAAHACVRPGHTPTQDPAACGQAPREQGLAECSPFPSASWTEKGHLSPLGSPGLSWKALFPPCADAHLQDSWSPGAGTSLAPYQDLVSRKDKLWGPGHLSGNQEHPSRAQLRLALAPMLTGIWKSQGRGGGT